MTDKFTITPLVQLLQIILMQLEKGRVFGIPTELFFKPDSKDKFRSSRFNQLLESPIGVAAGPHTQLAQNIVIAWLCGARYIELKTIQTLDELNVSKPCIDMQDEGYNCEWSQELKVEESFEQYLDAWIIIHILRHKFSWNKSDDPGVIFNMSVGYDYQGIQNNNVQWFLDKMADASEEIYMRVEGIKSIYPDAPQLKINPCISDNITLSTMHGCPVDEIEKIGLYLINERKLHTSIKLNPTLLGEFELYEILDNSGFETRVPASAFDHDPKFEEMVTIIRNLEKSARKSSVHFGLKLTNTLESNNHKEIFPSSENMMYLSGRALHPISIKVAEKLQNKFNGSLDISFCAGVDAFNIVDVVNCGLAPVTVCSDLLKPGGYGRLNQYIDQLRSGLKDAVLNKETISFNLKDYSAKVIIDDRYKKTDIHEPDIKTKRKLKTFDCINAPCVNTCPTKQGIPDYMYYTSIGNIEKAKEVILKTNPFPRMTGMICDHPCQMKCTLINYSNPVQIREVKRYVAENTNHQKESVLPFGKQINVAVIGAGPSGLSCAYFLAKKGITVSVYEKKQRPGGMVSGAIPAFRLTNNAFDSDLGRIIASGVNIEYGVNISKLFFSKLRKENDFVYISTGAQLSTQLDIENIHAKGVLEPLQFLFDAKANKPVGIGKNVLIIGGGNTAMDAARTAFRMVGKDGKVSILYRRTKKQMPADIGEIKAVMDESMEIIELASPVKIVTKNDLVRSLTCIKMELHAQDSSGRRRPVPIPGSEFTIECDTIIPAIGQDLDIDFVDVEKLKSATAIYDTQLENVFIGGDAMRGASTAINAIGDGRKVAEIIISKANLKTPNNLLNDRLPHDQNEHIINRTKRTLQNQTIETPLSDRKNFNLVSKTLSRKEAIQEASRCLLCDEFCSICTSVCPNLAFHTYEINPAKYSLQKIRIDNGNYEVSGESFIEISQKYQILHIADWCNECGNCTTFCPTADAPYKIKPHLYIDNKSFEKETDGYYLNRSSEYDILYFRSKDHSSILTKMDDHFLFKTDEIAFKLDLDSFQLLEISSCKKDKFEIDLKEAAEMFIIMQGAKSFYA